jgi:hypothetical protein
MDLALIDPAATPEKARRLAQPRPASDDKS